MSRRHAIGTMPDLAEPEHRHRRPARRPPQLYDLSRRLGLPTEQLQRYATDDDSDAAPWIKRAITEFIDAGGQL